jgi:hypothetical protein
MRGKSARVGSDFVAESPRNPLFPFHLPTKGGLFGWDNLQLFSGSDQVECGDPKWKTACH